MCAGISHVCVIYLLREERLSHDNNYIFDHTVSLLVDKYRCLKKIIIILLPSPW